MTSGAGGSPTLRVGLTGGIATGKSYVLARWREAGVPTVDADDLARAALAPGSDLARRVLERFGAAVAGEDGEFDRRRLAALVFNDDRARADLEALVHPPVLAAIGEWFDARGLERVRWAVAEVPLLFEAGLEGRFDRVVVVACTAEEQIRRLTRRDGLSPEEAAARLRAQWPIERKVGLAREIIRTDATLADTDRQADQVKRRFDALGNA